MDSNVHFFRLFCGRDENLMRFKNSSHKNLCFSDNRMTSYLKRDYCSILQEEIFRLCASPDDATSYRPRPYLGPNCRCWVAREFTVWRTHTRTSIIFSHALAHRTSSFDNRTRTRTFL